MRKPSRLMPKYIDPTLSPIGWLTLLVIGAVAVYVLWSRPLPLFAAVVLFTIWTIRGNKSKRRQLSHLAKSRNADALCQFARAFDTKQVDTWVIRATFEQIQDYMEGLYPKFPIRADDSLLEDLKVDDEDLEDVADEIAVRTCRSKEYGDNNPYFGKVITAKDMVLFFNAQPEVSHR